MARFRVATYDPRSDSSANTEAFRPGFKNQPEGLEGVILDWRDPKSAPDLRPCPCGCGLPVTGGKKVRFVMGHDARLKGILTRAYLTATVIHILHNPIPDAVDFPLAELASIEDCTAEEVAREFTTDKYDWVGGMKLAASKLGDPLDQRLAAADRRVLAHALRLSDDRKLLSVGRWERTGHLLAVWIGSDLEHHYEWVADDGKVRTAKGAAPETGHDNEGAE